MTPWDDIKHTIRRRMDVSEDSTIRQIKAEFKVALKKEAIVLSHSAEHRLLIQIIEDLCFPPPSPGQRPTWPEDG